MDGLKPADSPQGVACNIQSHKSKIDVCAPSSDLNWSMAPKSIEVHNFDALNIPKHPPLATCKIPSGFKTVCCCAVIQPPFKPAYSPSPPPSECERRRVYRNEAVDATHCHVSTRGVWVDRGLTFGHLGHLGGSGSSAFGDQTRYRFKPNTTPIQNHRWAWTSPVRTVTVKGAAPVMVQAGSPSVLEWSIQVLKLFGYDPEEVGVSPSAGESSNGLSGPGQQGSQSL